MDPLVGPIDKGVIWVTTAAFNFQGVLYIHQRHTLIMHILLSSQLPMQKHSSTPSCC